MLQTGVRWVYNNSVSYLAHLAKMSSPITFKRKVDYFIWNYGRFINIRKHKQLCILEIGPGMGESISYLNRHHITDIDVVDNDKEVLKYIGLHYKIHMSLHAKNILNIDTKLQSYDVIILTQVLEHIEKEYQFHWLQLLYKHLKKDGVILITVPNMANPLNTNERYGDITHECAFTENSLKELVTLSKISNFHMYVQNFGIPPFDPINVVRKIVQNILHFFILIFVIINGGVYSKLLSPNITLVVRKK